MVRGNAWQWYMCACMCVGVGMGAYVDVGMRVRVRVRVCVHESASVCGSEGQLLPRMHRRLLGKGPSLELLHLL
jgi:hypothetical protein